MASQLPELEIDTHPEITTALLTCIAAGYKHLIIRTPEEDIGRVKGLVVSALSSLNTPLIQRLRAKEYHTPLSFLRNVLVTQPGHNLDHSFSSVHGSASKPVHSPVRAKHRPVSPAGSPIRPLSHPNVPLFEQIQTRALSPNNQSTRPHSHPHRRNTTAPRVPHALVVSQLEVASRAVQQTLVDTLRTRIIIIDSDVDENSETSIGTGRWNLPADFLVVYVHAGGRNDRERSPIIKPLVDLFTYSLTVLLDEQYLGNIGSQYHTSQVAALNQEITKRIIEATNAIQIPLPLQIYMSSLMSAARHHHQLDGTFLTLRAQRDFEIILKASSVVARIFPVMRAYDAGAELAPTAVDAAKLFMRIVTHRLRVRNSPQDEVLSPLLWEAEDNMGIRSVPSLGLEHLEHTRRSICDIIIEDILTSV
ncbi:hypothetical protein RhiJN_07460 [Ceratobasidium sp. AG-Ba]|nr:hypothetical protein RhiJN_07460 [Ceratobasidium sp. AG-Ba]QRW08308.1 hypothetical protein RhiLY_07307 [Ceratobasidium sp. AG-Ba]